MKRRDHTVQGILFVIACMLIGVLIYQSLTGSGRPQASGNDQDMSTLVTNMEETPDASIYAENERQPAEPTVPAEPRFEEGTEVAQETGDSGAAGNEGGNCEARILRRVTALQTDDAVMEPGETWSSITQFWHNERTDDMWYCAHGDYCYPAWIRENGAKVKAIELTNCAVQSDRPERNGDETMYPVGR